MNRPALPPSTWTTGTTEVIRTGTWRAAAPVYLQAPSPCRLACPVDGRIPEWMQQAKAGDFHGAWITLTDHNPFPAVVGRVCHRPCEAACNRGGYDEPLAVRSLERHIGDLALAEGWRFPQSPVGQERVAVIGGGPSGLSAAYQLRRRGYAVSLFEAQRELGGLLRDGIPPYRLPHAVLDGEIRRILALGIDVHASIALTRPEQFLRLREQYGAVYVAIGARRQRRLAQLDYYVAPWVMDGAAYLAAANAGSPPALGKRVVAIGGGSAAMDVARSARRAGHEVSVLSLESEAEMPAQREEVVAAKEEGVRFFDGAALVSVRFNGTLKLHCVRGTFSRNPFTFIPAENSDFHLDADAIVPAIGSDPDLAALRPLLDMKGFYAGGDVVSPARFVSHAIGMGREAALEIDAWLMDRAPAPAADYAPVPLSAINTFYHPHRESSDPLTEAARCFSCGRCTLCDNCYQYCPDMAVRRVAGGYEIALEYCKGCGLCVAECPTGSIAMQEERK